MHDFARLLSPLRAHATRLLLDRRHRLNVARQQARAHPGLLPQAWGASISEQGRLVIGGCDVCRLAAEFGTPLLVVDRHRLESDFRHFRDSFLGLHPKVDVCFSYKTNPLPGVISVLHEQGALAEVISHFELWLALKLGVAPERIVLNGPGKGREAIALAARRSIKLINIDSLEEIRLVSAAARSAGARQGVGVRVVASVGWAAQFGLPMRGGDAFEAFRRLRREPDLLPIGLHLHLGTGLRDVQSYRQAVRETMEFAQQLRMQLGIVISYFDLGGGFGVPTVQPYDRWDERLMRHGRPPAPLDTRIAPTPTDYARAVIEVVRRYHPSTEAQQPTLAFEPGRALTSSAQSLVLRVLGVKHHTAQVPSVILDGGRNLALPTSYEHHELLPVTRAGQQAVRRYNFYGPLCHPGDCLFTQKAFPPVEPGELVALMDAGAYFVPNQTNFSHPRPAAVMVADGCATLIRRRESFDDIVMRDRFC
jgi:diaminopimelate decarboxylase